MKATVGQNEKKDMGHDCRICGRERPNEKFSGRGHTLHVCKDCAAMPKADREVIEQEEEVFGFMHQSHISAKNLERLKKLRESSNAHIRNLASILLEVAAATPFKKRRLKHLEQKHPDLLEKLEETGLIFAHHMD
jgi:hypothetical protein